MHIDNAGIEFAPEVGIDGLDVLWFQVAGTICNLRCAHCFISCSPENDTFAFLDLATCRRFLRESASLGVKEYYFTGGEPFANPAMLDILEETLRLGPATVLTNGTLLPDATIDRLAELDAAAPYSLELRVSLDGYNADMNDPLRGVGTFDRIMDGVRRLSRRGLLPIITITRTWECDDQTVLEEFANMLRAGGCERPRLKVLPSLRLGAEAFRSRGYEACERITPAMMEGYDPSQLLCSHGRMVTGKGVWVCPILLDSADAKLGDTLAAALRPYRLRHNACYTCWQFGAICSNVSVVSGGNNRTIQSPHRHEPDIRTSGTP